MRYTHCIWDFNGTVLNDVEAGILAVNQLLTERGIPTIESVETYRRVFCFPIKSYYERIGFDFSKESYEELAPKWVSLYLENVKRAELYPQIRESLQTLRERGIAQTLLSATELEMLKGQLEELALSDAFDEVWGLGNIHAHSKLALAKLWREQHPEAVAFLIGDTTHDKEAADEIGADCFLVTAGHQSEERLRETGALVFDSVADIFQYLQNREWI